MSAAIDYSIRQAEKHNKRGDINTAKAVIEKQSKNILTIQASISCQAAGREKQYAFA